MWEAYQYVYVSLMTKSGAHTKWVRKPKNKVGEWIEEHPGALSYFQTIQSFSNLDKTEGESHWSPLFFDLDAKDYRDDLTAKEKIAALKPVLSDARKVIDYFVTGFDVLPQIWFSGKKGFHITVPGEVFGADPDIRLTYHWKHLAAQMAKKLDVESLDWRVYSIPRMWRIENTQHKSGKYKIPLEIADLAKGIEYIVSLAATPCSERVMVETQDDVLGVEPLLNKLYKDALEEFTERIKVIEGEALEAPVFTTEHPPCAQYLLDNGLAELGTKNQADMALANYCKASGMDIGNAERFMTDWAQSISPNLTHIDKPKARALQSLRVLKTVYSDPKYRFSCGSMLACSIDVDCKQCSVKKDSKATSIQLADFSEAANYGRKVSVEADVIGRDKAELIVPKKILGWCPFNPDSAMCGRCSMANYFNTDANRMERTIVFDAAERLTVSLVDSTKAGLHHKVKQIFGVEQRCYSFKYEVEWGNARVVYLSTRISGDFRVEQDLTKSRAIYLGHTVDLNKGYTLYGYVWSHPTTSKAILVIDTAELLQSSLSEFSLTDEELNTLTIFQVEKDQTPLEKIKSIHKIFNTGFIRVFGREQLIMAVDLVFHSARRFNFQKTEGLKGWLDILILGDTRQGKSDVAEKLMDYYDLGVLAAGETASRAGLLYAVHMIAGEEAWIAFGLLCRANGYLVVIDEIHGMSPSDFKEFTLVRSKGIVDVVKFESGAAYAETRLISIANARPGKALSSYGYPVQAIPDIPTFQALEDVSRFDFVVGVKAGDVSDEAINQDVYDLEEVENIYTPELCRNLILWLWTRQPDDVVFERETEIHILDLAMKLSQDYIPDIPIVESADIRHKIARIAAAVAGRVYSTTDSKHLDVKPEHADAAVEILEDFYRAPGLDYFGWSDERRRVVISPERQNELRYEFQVAFVNSWESIAKWILEVNDFNKTLLRAAVGTDQDDTNQLMAFLITNRFIVTDKHKYVKTPSGREFLRCLFEPPKEIKEKEGEF